MEEKIQIGSITPFGLRMPPELKLETEHPAISNKRSLNSEIISRLTVDSLSLRDAFAIATLTGLGTWMPNGYGNLNTTDSQKARAEFAYAQADAMLAARKTGDA